VSAFQSTPKEGVSFHADTWTQSTTFSSRDLRIPESGASTGTRESHDGIRNDQRQGQWGSV